MYDNTTPVIPEAFTLIQKFLANKKGSDQVFDHVQPEDLNEYFKSIMEGLSAKVFRTYNASITLCSELHKTDVQVTKAKIAKESRDPRSHAPHSPHSYR